MKRKYGVLLIGLTALVLSLTGCRFHLPGAGTSSTGNTGLTGGGSAGGSGLGNLGGGNLTEGEEIAAKKKVIEDLIDEKFFFDQPTEEEKEAYMYKGLVASLGDKYSEYYTPEELQKIMESDSGVYEGIGVSVSQNADTKIITVMKVFAGSGAEKAGILPKDIIVEVNGTRLTDEDINEVVAVMRGEEGTTVDITVYRPSTDKEISMTVERHKIVNSSLGYHMIDSKIGYIELSQFQDNTDEQFNEAVDALTAQGMQSLIIDLRDNPGGYVNTAANICNRIISNGVIVTEKDRDGNVLESISADDQASLDIPIVLLVNGGSASASELMAGCLQDYGKAKLVGTQTFGKGIVQEIIPLSDGSAVKLTVASYYLPSGKCIHEVGIAPDIVVELPEELQKEPILSKEQDVQLQRAVQELGGSTDSWK